MLEDIKKILNISKQSSIVVMDEGKPEYVIVPFKEYSENMEVVKKSAEILERNSEFRESLDDMSFEDVNNIIEKELKFNRGDYPESYKMDTEKEAFDTFEQNRNDGLNLREIKLEDLPF